MEFRSAFRYDPGKSFRGWLRTVTIGAALVGFVPLCLLAGPLGWGLAGVWTGLTLFIVIRLAGVLVRVAGHRAGERRT